MVSLLEGLLLVVLLLLLAVPLHSPAALLYYRYWHRAGEKHDIIERPKAGDYWCSPHAGASSV